MTDPDEILRDCLVEHTSLINYNAVLFNGLLSLLIEKGIITQEELRVARLREVAGSDQQIAKMHDPRKAKPGDPPS